MSNTITLDKLKRINQMGDRARHLASIINLSDSAAELGGTLQHLGFHKMEYLCQGCDTYKDGAHAYSGAGISRTFTRWVRVDEMLHAVDEIDVVDGTIKCRDTSQAWCDAIELVHYGARRILADAYTEAKE